MVIERNGCIDAFDVHGVHLGSFRKTKRAIAAVNASAPVAVCDASARRDGSP